MTNKKETAQEVPVQEQQIQRIINSKLRKYKNFHTTLFIIQTLIILMFTIMLFKEKSYTDDLNVQLKILKDLISIFKI